MNADAIREFLHREPFEPFVIRMSNGETHEVRHPECLRDANQSARLLSGKRPLRLLRTGAHQRRRGPPGDLSCKGASLEG